MPQITILILTQSASKTTINNFSFFPPRFADCIVIFISSRAHDVSNRTIMRPTTVSLQVVSKKRIFSERLNKFRPTRHTTTWAVSSDSRQCTVSCIYTASWSHITNFNVHVAFVRSRLHTKVLEHFCSNTNLFPVYNHHNRSVDYKARPTQKRYYTTRVVRHWHVIKINEQQLHKISHWTNK